ncbi:MAG: bifunctional demethylmenaquinone methyltransferase/2-methoxy-6-polyprenyl-1,4-benzoquinol methylase UbiE [Proteobacteria bacterium]|nr:bifunctional demethylmenaquinone methyltransferase/2-methoxy-6-polyprenyl-1,4-benzoquinol methylase UbiE [Pseudomonadota bacterium]MBU1386478.1 bifunctional demethylmenaquinone methyltransferase/2-methoxy-6-polyprenyl-1,4-benzoquinol methylase UbiE [Pseudomonadota bacterium]MBU1544589.1 bifunctional demethylmenaquinone methyltransferase/2-methoxy-6-polyprenyl-1,4-benzoquinol methylase UbiE [Pseudomonadota bacterium]MBU2430771.1 bifunctional demethylmenaquinone methyltransferase/2-methoxy-6-po
MNKELDFVKGMFDKIAPKYDFLNRLLSLGQDTVWRKQMVQAATLEKDCRILDVACGTCDVSLEADKQLSKQISITGLDFSYGMLRLGRAKIKNKKNISLLNADALNLPFRSMHFDAVFIAFGIRNIMNRQQALHAFYEVLKPGGRLAVLELSTPDKGWLKALYLLYFQKILPLVGSFFSKDQDAYSYLPESVLKFPSADAFSGLMKQAGFKQIKFKQMTLGIVTLFIGTRV